MVEETKKPEIEVKNAENINIERTLKIFAVVIGIFLLACIVLIKVINPNLSLLWVIILMAVVIGVSCLMFFWFRLFKKKEIKEEKITVGKLPQPLSLDSLRRLAQSALTNEFYANHLQAATDEKFYHIGKINKARIFVYHSKLLYADEAKNGEVYIIINAHFPEELRSILIDPTPYELNHTIKMLSNEPEDEPNISESVIFNPMTNTIQQSRKVEKPREEKKEEHKEQKEDLE